MSYPSHKNWKEIPTIDETTEYGSVIHWSKVVVVPFRNHPVHTTRIVPVTCICGSMKTQIVNDLKQHKYKGLCLKCSAKLYVRRGERHADWKGGKSRRQDGYNVVSIDILTPEQQELIGGMKHSHGKYILEHRLVVALHLGRPLIRDEHIHHVNGIKTDNRIENLRLVTPSEHADVELTWARLEITRLRKILDEHGISF